MRRWFSCFVLILVLMLAAQDLVISEEFYVDDVSVNGDGSQSNPFSTVSAAMDAAKAGDVIFIMPGSYTEKIRINKSGAAGQPITLEAADTNNRPVFAREGNVLEINARHVTVDGLILNGEFGNSDVVKITSGSDFTTIRNSEIKNGRKDGIDLNAADDVLIENCEIHHMLGGSLNSQKDAHGIVATGEKNLTIRGCDIYYVSGDCFQTDPNRGNPLWDNVLIENSRLWTGPLPADAAGWNAGEIPGENAVDTKINPDAAGTDYRAKITIRNVEAFGFVPGFISNRAAFNIKEKVDCQLIAVKVYNNEVAFRLRGPGSKGGAFVTILNSVIFDNDKAFRTEDDLERLRIYNCTFDKGANADYFQNVSGGFEEAGFDLKNSLFLNELPDEATHSSNIMGDDTFILDRNGRDYRLRSNSPAIDAGVNIPEVTDDFSGNPRQSGALDVGAFEFSSASGVGDPAEPGRIKSFYLHPNFPNPFNPETNITFDMTSAGLVELSIFDPLGRIVATLVSEQLPTGQHSTKWSGVDQLGNQVASGMYLFRLAIGQFTQTRKMQLLR